MTITEEQRQRRKKYVCSSDVAAIVGMSPFSNPATVAIEKIHDVEPAPNRLAFRLGQFAEAMLLDYAREDLGWELQVGDPVTGAGDEFFVGECGVMAAHLDARRLDKPAVVECKYSGSSAEWGEPHTDLVPNRVVLQVQAAMYCAGLEWAHVLALLPSYHSLKINVYEIPRDDVIIGSIVEASRKFLVSVRKGLIPEGSEPPNLDTLKRVVRKKHSVAVLDGELMQRVLQKRAEARDSQSIKSDAEAELIAAMGDAEIAHAEGREDEFTLFSQSRESYGMGNDVENVCPECGVGEKHSEFRVLRHRKKKK